MRGPTYSSSVLHFLPPLRPGLPTVVYQSHTLSPRLVMIDFSKRRFTIRIGRTTKLKNGEQLSRRTSVIGRKTSTRSTRRVSVRNSTALRRAPSAAGGLHRGASVRRSQSGVRRGASVKRAPSAARRNSKRISTMLVERYVKLFIG